MMISLGDHNLANIFKYAQKDYDRQSNSTKEENEK